MNILYIGYWNLRDPLTVSTVFPNLATLSEMQEVERIVFVNIEREWVDSLPERSDLSKVVYHPYQSGGVRNLWMEKFRDFTRGPRHLQGLARQYAVDVMIARGAPAGALAWHVWRKLGIPFLVESFEPHADYMLESGVWKWYDPRHMLQRLYEKLQKGHACGIMPVAHNYRVRLIKEGIEEERVLTVPCVVDHEAFSFSQADRNHTRAKLGFESDAIIGIYVGRYGGLYLEDEAFALYRGAFGFFGDRFKLILLTPSDYHAWIETKIQQYGLPRSSVFVRNAGHKEVPGYLSASDFGYATYKTGKSKAFLSPVKIAEYWANGLPVMLTKGIGDESNILEESPNAGVLFDPGQIDFLSRHYYEELNQKLARRCHPANSIVDLARTYRHPSMVRHAYEYFLNKIVS